jgi:hypothetical protein
VVVLVVEMVVAVEELVVSYVKKYPYKVDQL